ncbi:hypothetical protein [Saccharopolyspora sp. NPDC049426]|uniref:hypothetical protein n=1 Tax=Saccharopolyspora sp. NPDC049426 TaxID=3155652 RepID=UPI003421DEFC
MAGRGIKFWTIVTLGVILTPTAMLITSLYDAPAVVWIPVLILSFGVYIAILVYVDRVSRGRNR